MQENLVNKIIRPIAVLCCSVFLSGCGGGSRNTQNEPSSFAINTDTIFKVGETRRIENTDTNIKLDAVIQDNRCGKNMSCFAGGLATVRVLVSDRTDKNQPFAISDAFGGLTLPQTPTRPAYTISIEVPEPLYGPGTTLTPTFPQKDYRILLRVTPTPTP